MLLLPRHLNIGGRGIVFDRFLCLYLCIFVCFFVSKITRKRLDWFAWNFQGKCGVTVGRRDSIFGQFGETARCRDAQHGDGVCCAFAPQLVLFSLLYLEYDFYNKYINWIVNSNIMVLRDWVGLWIFTVKVNVKRSSVSRTTDPPCHHGYQNVDIEHPGNSPK